MLPSAQRAALGFAPVAGLVVGHPARAAGTGGYKAVPALSALFAVLGLRCPAMNAPEALLASAPRHCEITRPADGFLSQKLRPGTF